MHTALVLLLAWIAANVLVISSRFWISRRRHSIHRWPYTQPVYVVIDRTRPE